MWIFNSWHFVILSTVVLCVLLFFVFGYHRILVGLQYELTLWVGNLLSEPIILYIPSSMPSTLVHTPTPIQSYVLSYIRSYHIFQIKFHQTPGSIKQNNLFNFKWKSPKTKSRDSPTKHPVQFNYRHRFNLTKTKSNQSALLVDNSINPQFLFQLGFISDTTEKAWRHSWVLPPPLRVPSTVVMFTASPLATGAETTSKPSLQKQKKTLVGDSTDALLLLR